MKIQTQEAFLPFRKSADVAESLHTSDVIGQEPYWKVVERVRNTGSADLLGAAEGLSSDGMHYLDYLDLVDDAKSQVHGLKNKASEYASNAFYSGSRDAQARTLINSSIGGGLGLMLGLGLDKLRRDSSKDENGERPDRSMLTTLSPAIAGALIAGLKTKPGDFNVKPPVEFNNLTNSLRKNIIDPAVRIGGGAGQRIQWFIDRIY